MFSTSYGLVVTLHFDQRKAERMTLRIDISDERDRVVFALTGRIQAEQVSELQALVKSDLPNHRVVLDLNRGSSRNRGLVRSEVGGPRCRALPGGDRGTGRQAQELLCICSGVDFTRAAWDAARQLRSGSNTRYEGGVTSYLEVITAQNAALSDEVTAVTILGRRMASLKRSVEDGIDRICPIARDAAESS
jgi:hypothetical protein